jgi:hypothetical protein
VDPTRRGGRLDLGVGPPLRGTAGRRDHAALRGRRHARRARVGHRTGPHRVLDVLRALPQPGAVGEGLRRHRPHLRRTVRTRVRRRLARAGVPRPRLRLRRRRRALRHARRGLGDHQLDAVGRRPGRDDDRARPALPGRRGHLRPRAVRRIDAAVDRRAGTHPHARQRRPVLLGLERAVRRSGRVPPTQRPARCGVRGDRARPVHTRAIGQPGVPSGCDGGRCTSRTRPDRAAVGAGGGASRHRWSVDGHTGSGGRAHRRVPRRRGRPRQRRATPPGADRRPRRLPDRGRPRRPRVA